jgi:hypothetical protein
MAMYYYRLNTFDEVAKQYDSVTPIRGTALRPIGDRRRKWEHIVKLSANKYCLMDMIGDGAGRFWCGTWEEEVERAAVTWTRSPTTGIEKIRIRNGYGVEANHNQRYSFLERALPSNMAFLVEHGKQYVVTRDGTKYYLPKSKWVNECMYDNLKQQRITHGATAWNSQPMTMHCDGTYLDFTRDPITCEWTMVSKMHLEPITRYRISKDKKPYYDNINKLTEWAWIMRDMLHWPDRDWKRRHELREQCGNAMDDHLEFRSMLTDEEDLRRTPVVSMMLDDLACYDWQTQQVTLPSDPKEFTSKFKRQIDTLAGFKTKHKEYKAPRQQ